MASLPRWEMTAWLALSFAVFALALWLTHRAVPITFWPPWTRKPG